MRLKKKGWYRIETRDRNGQLTDIIETKGSRRAKSYYHYARRQKKSGDTVVLKRGSVARDIEQIARHRDEY
jgi:hypothetical protein